MVQRRAPEAAGLDTYICNHTWRGTGITTYLENGGALENAKVIAGSFSMPLEVGPSISALSSTYAGALVNPTTSQSRPSARFNRLTRDAATRNNCGTTPRPTETRGARLRE